MNVDLLLTGISQLVTARGRGPKHGLRMSQLDMTADAAIAVLDGTIAWIGKYSEWDGQAAEVVDIGGRAVTPALIDPHTHAVWAGDRLDDFDARSSGRSYEEILRTGGGIRSSIQATVAASRSELVELAAPRIASLVRSGAAVIEVKSGYGFEISEELKMLEAIEDLRKRTSARLVATLLIHIPPVNREDRATYVSEVCERLIPEVTRRLLASCVDVFVEKEAWHADEASSMLRCAQQFGLAIKLHTEQFQRIGGLELGVAMGALSVDHLEECDQRQMSLVAASETIATILPGVSLHLGIRSAPGRKLVDSGAAIAIGTDLNPGSSPLFSMAAALALGVRMNGLTAAEALVAGTANAACAVGLQDDGRLEAGLRADFLVLEGRDWRELVYTLGANPVREVWIGGKKVKTDRDLPMEAM